MKQKNELRSIIRQKERSELVRINWNIVRRIVSLLYYQCKLKKSEIATKSKLGYDKCKRYLNWMEMMDLIQKETNDDGYEVVLLTNKSVLLYNEKFRDA